MAQSHTRTYSHEDVPLSPLTRTNSRAPSPTPTLPPPAYTPPTPSFQNSQHSIPPRPSLSSQYTTSTYPKQQIRTSSNLNTYHPSDDESLYKVYNDGMRGEGRRRKLCTPKIMILIGCLVVVIAIGVGLGAWFGTRSGTSGEVEIH